MQKVAEVRGFSDWRLKTLCELTELIARELVAAVQSESAERRKVAIQNVRHASRRVLQLSVDVEAAYR